MVEKRVDKLAHGAGVIADDDALFRVSFESARRKDRFPYLRERDRLAMTVGLVEEVDGQSRGGLGHAADYDCPRQR